MSSGTLVQRWQDKNEVWHFECSTKNLEKLVNAIGYRDQGFGSAVEEFLNDNPGAQLAIVEWIDQQVEDGRVREWAAMLEDEVGPDEDEEQEDE